MRLSVLWVAVVGALALVACQRPSRDPAVVLQAKQALGRRLFYDVRLSVNHKRSCGSCHLQERAFTDGLTRAVGATGQVVARNSPTLLNVARREKLLWAKEPSPTLKGQLEVPMFAQHPVEMGLTKEALVERVGQDARYVSMFEHAFPEQDGLISVDTISDAIITFEAQIISDASPYDRYKAGDQSALSAQAKHGMKLFFGHRFQCSRCHGGDDLDSVTDHSGAITARHGYFNIGLYNVDGQGAYPAIDTGLFATTKQPKDMGRFRAPTLRNVAMTAPYMHDGSVASLEEVVRLYAQGGRALSAGEHQGDGRESPVRDELILGFFASNEEVDAVVAFMESLTDEEVIKAPHLSDPFKAAASSP